MKAWVAEIHQKDEHYKQLLEALEALPKDMTRAVYTRSILEIVKNVKKQKVPFSLLLLLSFIYSICYFLLILLLQRWILTRF